MGYSIGERNSLSLQQHHRVYLLRGSRAERGRLTEFVEIDGSFGEGGGQILRTTLSLSCITGKPVRIFNIRKNRPKPGLMPQHLMSVEALARISGAEARGTEPSSQEISFKPGQVTAGEYLSEQDIEPARSYSAGGNSPRRVPR